MILRHFNHYYLSLLLNISRLQRSSRFVYLDLGRCPRLLQSVPLALKKRSLYSFLLMLSSLIAMSCGVFAQSQSDETSAVRTGTISGRVVNESGQPLANAIVSVRPFGVMSP